MAITYSEYDPSNLGSFLVLDSPLIARVTSGVQRTACGDLGISDGAAYYECDLLGGPGYAGMVGVTNAPATAKGGTYCGSTSAGWGYNWDSNIYHNGGIIASLPLSDLTPPAALVMVFIDSTATNVFDVWFGANGDWSGDPSARTGPALTGISGPLYIATTPGNIAASLATINTGQSSFLYTPPTGGENGWSSGAGAGGGGIAGNIATNIASNIARNIGG